MRKKFFTICLCTLAFASCSKFDLDYDSTVVNEDKEAINENAASILGTIDPNQTWNSIKSGFVTITADANLDNIAKVQILTESPFMNPDAKVLNEVTATNGQTVTLVYDAPNVYTRLIAACVNKEGVYYTKGFDIGTTEVSFQNTTAASRGSRRASADYYNFPDMSNFTLPYNMSFLSYNAVRHEFAEWGKTDIIMWKDSDWLKERFWRNNSSNQSNNKLYKVTYEGSDWYMQNFSIRRDLSDALSEEEEANLQDIFTNYLYWDDGENLQKNNLEAIRESNMVTLYNNQLIADGEPVIITPVQGTSTEMQYCDLYYYYYNPEVVQNMTDDEKIQYIKNLPKFMAMSCNDALPDAKNTNANFFKNHEYVLPYYGDPQDHGIESIVGYTSDGKIYRIRNGRTYEANNNSFYMGYTSDYRWRMRPYYDENVAEMPMQLWQIFYNADKTSCYLFNVGTRRFIYPTNNNGIDFSITDYVDSNCTPFKVTEENGVHHFMRTDESNYVGTEYASNYYGYHCKAKSDDGSTDWYVEEYNGSKTFVPKTEIESIATPYAAQSYSMPKGYILGFVIRKAMTNPNDSFAYYYNSTYNATNNGELYADGRLNRQINQFKSHFISDTNEAYIQEDDPRATIFTANNKMYMTFEDGSDCNYVDIILEMTNGIELVDETPDPNTEAYTMCFEDRPVTADYDMNDVVLSCTRKDATTFTLSLVACGANDSIFIHDALGLWEYNGKEVHQIFGLEDNGFVNTVVGGTTMEPVSADITVPESMTIPAYLKNIFIENKSTGKIIKIADQGQAPCAIIIPGAFNYPRERVSIINAYTKFKNWAQDATADTDWYLYEEEDQVYPNPVSAE